MPVTALAATKTVLVADDTAFVRDRFTAALEAAGYTAVTAGSSADLVARVRADAPRIDLLVLDLRLPQGHGVDLVRALRQIDQRVGADDQGLIDNSSSPIVFSNRKA